MVQISGITNKVPNYKSQQEKSLIATKFFVAINFKMLQSIAMKIFWGKLHITTLNYALNYTLHPKLSDCTLCTLNHYTYHALHPSVIFAVIFNRILLHVTSTCFLLRWNKVKRLKHHSSKSIKTKPKIFHISLCLTCLPSSSPDS